MISIQNIPTLINILDTNHIFSKQHYICMLLSFFFQSFLSSRGFLQSTAQSCQKKKKNRKSS